MPERDVSIVIRFNTKPAADAMQSLLTVINQTGGQVEQLGEVPVPVPEGLPATQNTIGAIREEIRRLSEDLEKTEIGGPQFDQLSQRLVRANLQLTNATNSQSRFAGSSVNARMMLQQFTFGLQDAPMFMTNFRMGLMSVGNNLDMVAQTFVRVRQEAAETGKSVSSLVGGALKGPAGILIAVSVLIGLLQVLPQLFKKTGEEAGKAAEDGLKKFADRTRQMSTETLNAAKAEQERMIIQAERDLAEMKRTPAKADIGGGALGISGADVVSGKTEGFTAAQIAAKEKEINDMREQRKSLTDILLQRDQEVGSSLIRQEEAELRNLQLQRDSLTQEQVAKGELIRLNREIELQEIRIKTLREEGVKKMGGGLPSMETQKKITADRIDLADKLNKVEGVQKDFIKDLLQGEADAAAGATLLEDSFQSAAETARSELGREAARGFASAWEGAFGEVNSTFEIMLTSMIDSMIQKFADAAVSDILFTVFGFGAPGGLFKLFGLADGAVVTKPTIAMIGEAGPEGVIPLNRAANFFPTPPAPPPIQVVNKITVTGRIRRGDIYLLNRDEGRSRNRNR